jgi:hypothetical protein
VLADTENQTSGYSESIVVLLDILGFSEVIKLSGHDHAKPLDALRTLRDLPKLTGYPADFYVFSDTILWVLRLAELAEYEGAGRMLQQMAAIGWASESQRALLDRGFMVQGGISQGLVYSDRDAGIVFGPALVDAHELASQHAHVARIAVQEPVIPDEWKTPESLHGESPMAVMNDGVWFVDYLKVPPPHVLDAESARWREQMQRLERNRKALLAYTSRARTPVALARCTWAFWYHNTWVRRLLWRKDPKLGQAVGDLRARLEELVIPELEFKAHATSLIWGASSKDSSTAGEN